MTDIFDLESRSILIDGLAGDIGSCSGRRWSIPAGFRAMRPEAGNTFGLPWQRCVAYYRIGP